MQAFAEEYILKPLGMTHTIFKEDHHFFTVYFAHMCMPALSIVSLNKKSRLFEEPL